MPSFKIDEEVVDKLADLLKKHDLSEIEIQEGESRIKVSMKTYSEGMVCAPSMVNQNFSGSVSIPESSAGAVPSWANHPGAVKSPMIGTCYLSPEPGAQTFVKVGDSVKIDQPLLIIESMKVMNLIKSQKNGTVVHVAVGDDEPVEYGQVLMVIE